jgi:hypothetical protein
MPTGRSTERHNANSSKASKEAGFEGRSEKEREMNKPDEHGLAGLVAPLSISQTYDGQVEGGAL